MVWGYGKTVCLSPERINELEAIADRSRREKAEEERRRWEARRRAEKRRQEVRRKKRWERRERARQQKKREENNKLSSQKKELREKLLKSEHNRINQQKRMIVVNDEQQRKKLQSLAETKRKNVLQDIEQYRLGNKSTSWVQDFALGAPVDQKKLSDKATVEARELSKKASLKTREEDIERGVKKEKEQAYWDELPKLPSRPTRRKTPTSVEEIVNKETENFYVKTKTYEKSCARIAVNSYESGKPLIGGLMVKTCYRKKRCRKRVGPDECTLTSENCDPCRSK